MRKAQHSTDLVHKQTFSRTRTATKVLSAHHDSSYLPGRNQRGYLAGRAFFDGEKMAQTIDGARRSKEALNYFGGK
jgi:hypothetical protein